MFKDRRTAMIGTLVLALFLLSLTLTNPGKALAISAFLKIDGVEGEAQDAKHKGEIEVISWSFGETHPGMGTRGGAGSAGKVNMQDFKFTMRTNKASPTLFLRGADGKVLPKTVLSVRRTSDKNQEDFLQITLSNSIVSSFLSMGASGTPDAYPIEEILLNFSQIKISYRPMKADGTYDPFIETGWDVKSMEKR